jgi:hypothetical protein
MMVAPNTDFGGVISMRGYRRGRVKGSVGEGGSFYRVGVLPSPHESI